jgi:hypothetical protein
MHRERLIPWRAETGDILHVPCYYSPEATDTIISPTDVVLSHPHLYSAFSQFGHCATRQGNITFYRISGTMHAVYPLHMRNGLWYNTTMLPASSAPNIDYPMPPQEEIPNQQTTHARINRLSGQVRYMYYPMPPQGEIPNQQTTHAQINRLSGQVRYVYYHQKYAHPSD